MGADNEFHGRFKVRHVATKPSGAFHIASRSNDNSPWIHAVKRFTPVALFFRFALQTTMAVVYQDTRKHVSVLSSLAKMNSHVFTFFIIVCTVG